MKECEYIQVNLIIIQTSINRILNYPDSVKLQLVDSISLCHRVGE